MDNTATLPPPAAHAAGPAIRRREGAAGKGFAAALRLAEAPGAPAAATAGPGSSGWSRGSGGFARGPRPRRPRSRRCPSLTGRR